MLKKNQLLSLLAPHCYICIAMFCLIIATNIICHLWGEQIQINWEASDRMQLKSILYTVTVFLFPLVNLIRYILIRLNQTMPGDKSAKQRYFETILCCIALIEIVGLFGLLMYVLGEDYSTLYIFSILAILGLYLHMPKLNEYQTISNALDQQKFS